MNNKVAKIIKNISIFIYVSGFLSGLIIALVVVGNLPSLTEGWVAIGTFISILTVTWISTFISGSLFLAIAEIVFLLQTISNNTGQNIDNAENGKDKIIDNEPNISKKINYKYWAKIVLVIVSILTIIGFLVFNNISFKQKLNATWTGNWVYVKDEPERRRIQINVIDKKIRLCKGMDCEEYDAVFEVLKLESIKFKIEGFEYNLIISSKDYATLEIDGKRIGLKKLSGVYLNNEFIRYNTMI